MIRKKISIILIIILFVPLLSTGGTIQLSMEENDGASTPEGPPVIHSAFNSVSSRGSEWSDTFDDKVRIESDKGIGITNEGAEIPHLLISDDFVAANGVAPNPFFWSIVGVGTDVSDFTVVQGQKLRIWLSMSGSYNSLGVASVNPVNSNSFDIDVDFTVLDAADEDANITISNSLGTPFSTVVISSASSQAKVMSRQNNIYSTRVTSTVFFSVGITYNYHIIVTPTLFQVVIKRVSDLVVMWDSGQVSMDGISFDNTISFSCSGTTGTGDTRFDNIVIENTLTSGWLRSANIYTTHETNWDVLSIDKTEPVGTALTVTICNANTDSPITGFIGLSMDGGVDISGIDRTSIPAIYLNASFTGTGSLSPILHSWAVSWNNSGVWRDTLFTGVKVSDLGDTRTDNGNVTLAPDPTSWTKYSGNPVLSTGSSGQWDDDCVQFSHVIKEGSLYKMWYAGYGGSGTSWKIGYATSTDCINWVKQGFVLDVGSSGSWDDTHVIDPFVIHEDGIYKMWYNDFEVSTNRMEIGYATSINGISWIKSNENPIFSYGSTGTWDGLNVGGTAIVRDRGSCHLWYQGANNPTNYRIGYASSSDGLTWSRYGSNPVLDVGPSSTWEAFNVFNPSVIRSEGLLGMWYTGSTSSYNQCIGYATSADGINWVKDTTNPVLSPGLGWDSYLVSECNVIFDETIYRMWYTGSNQLQFPFKIGYAYSQLKSPTTLTTTPINAPANSYYDTLIIGKTVPLNTALTVSVLNGTNDQPISGYQDLTGEYLDLSNIDPLAYPSIKLQATLSSTGSDTPVLHDWSLNFSQVITKTPPQVGLPSPESYYVFRTDMINISITAFDIEDPPELLDLTLQYRSPNGDWEDLEAQWQIDTWRGSYIPGATATLGLYSLRVKASDTDQMESEWATNLNCFEVLNNDPGTPIVRIYPPEPRTYNDLVTNIIVYAEDVENELIEYSYQWYKNEVLQDSEDSQAIPYDLTKKGDLWRCEVKGFDGHDWGRVGSDEVIVRNTPPDVIDPPLIIHMFEDQTDRGSINLNEVFEDIDDDPLSFGVQNSEHLSFEIFANNGSVIIRPQKNWFGTETVHLTANDTLSENLTDVTFVVAPVNDPPMLIKIGEIEVASDHVELIAYEDIYLNITLVGIDVDNDLIAFGCNLTDGVGNDEREDMVLISNSGYFSFLPGNEDVGMIPMTFWVFDPFNAIDIVTATITVLNVNDLPEIEIIEPLERTFTVSSPINFSAIASDPDERWGAELLTIYWNSNITGSLGQGESLSNITTLSVGTHLITASVQDKVGATNSDTIEVTIVPLDVVETPQQDEKKESSGSYYWWLLLLSIMVLIFIAIFFILIRKREKEREDEQSQTPPQSVSPLSPGPPSNAPQVIAFRRAPAIGTTAQQQFQSGQPGQNQQSGVTPFSASLQMPSSPTTSAPVFAAPQQVQLLPAGHPADSTGGSSILTTVDPPRGSGNHPSQTNELVNKVGTDTPFQQVPTIETETPSYIGGHTTTTPEHMQGDVQQPPQAPEIIEPSNWPITSQDAEFSGEPPKRI